MRNSARLLYLLLVVLTLQACKTIQPPAHPVANMFPTVDITAKLETLKPCSITIAQLQEAMQTMNIWSILQTAGLPASEMPILTRGLHERGYAEIDARRAASPLLWVSITSPNSSNKIFIRAAFAKIPPYNCRQGLLPEKQHPDRSIRTLTRNGRKIPQRVSVWQSYKREEGAFQILQIFGKKNNTVSHWEIYQAFPLDNDAS